MSGAHGIWQQTGGGGPDVGSILTLAALAGAAVIAVSVAEFVLAIPAYVWALTATGIIAAVVFTVIYQRRRTVAFAAVCAANRAEREAIDEARKQHRLAAEHQRNLEIAAVQSPRVNVDLGALADLLRDRDPSVITLPSSAYKEVPR